MNLKRINDSLGYPESLAELQDWGLSPRVILEQFDTWASQDMINEFAKALSDAFDGPESLDDTICDYIDHTFDGMERDAVAELDKFLSQDQINKFIADFDKDFNFSNTH